MPDRSRTYARIAGILYLVTHATSIAAVAAYAGGALTGGVTVELLLAGGCLGTGILLWLLLGQVGPARAATFAALRALEAALIAAGTLPMLALQGTTATGPMAETLVALHTAAFLVGQGLVISANTIILGWLLFTTGLVPRALAALGLIGGTLVLASNSAQLFDMIPQGGTIAGVCALPIFAFEIWFAIHLITVGLRPRASVRALSGSAL
ncbi:DUF4386 domain-containing protein [Microbacterium sp. NRRL B-14842]|uniref:DUF4386 domain-containing protein n=1 Tax=Microbacterium sp. NRRL B-14842 TaxID=3162881 RepID=UPI003512D78B